MKPILLCVALVLLTCMPGSLIASRRNPSNSAGDQDSSSAQSDEVKRVNAAATVFDDIMNVPDKGIPDKVLASAKCIAVVPSLIKAGFIFGGRHGDGIATCRTRNGWSAPAPFTLTGGSWGLQFGGEAVDLIMLAMNDKGKADLLASKFKLGTGMSIAAGPVGRDGTDGNDSAEPEILSYSRSRGIFAGIDLNGAVIRQDNGATQRLYGRVIPFKAILLGKVSPPDGTRHFLAVVRKWTTPSTQPS
ncbi:MAG TPA: lipid-binding SYLF domain-containing protein [Terriglobales bacterium]|nr:lipid-binding SYLF domain-containing protein [Terriglobales bacterium]